MFFSLFFVFCLLPGCAIEENPFLDKITQKGLEPRTSGVLELKILQVGVDVIATLSKSDMLRLIPDSYGGDLQGTWGEPSTDSDPGEAGSGTFLNSEFRMMPRGASYEDAEPGPNGANGTDCNIEGNCSFVPRNDSIFLMHFEITSPGGLIENALNFIKTQPQDDQPKREMQELLNMTPNNLPITKIPVLGTLYSVVYAIADFIGLGSGFDNMVRNSIADMYAIGRNQNIVSPQFVQEAVVRNIIYPIADGTIVKEEDLNFDDFDNRRRLVVLCEQNANCYANGSCAYQGGGGAG
ncbi:MAG: hypothetical protein KDK27_21150, partial [Leptospiraceae bacterium]|nr:hypothetical protein [Leptospiraceae bacterium]